MNDKRTIEFEQGGVKVSLEVPGPMQQDGVWCEFCEYRFPKKNELYFYRGCYIVHALSDHGGHFEDIPCWIATPIPTPTPEQLKAIGMKLRDDRPMVCRADDFIWSTARLDEKAGEKDLIRGCHDCIPEIGHYRWHLVPAKADPVHTSCCKNWISALPDKSTNRCGNCARENDTCRFDKTDREYYGIIGCENGFVAKIN
jgi:hypothetical protein